MFDLSTISSAKKKAEINQEKLSGNYEDEYNQGITYLKEFAENHLPENLNKATGKFFEALKYRRNHVEPYFFISYACFLFEEEETAFKYLELAEEIDANYPHLTALKELLKSN